MKTAINWLITCFADALIAAIVCAPCCGQILADGPIEHRLLWRYHAPSGACEIGALSPATGKLFVTVGGGVDVVSVRSGERLGEIASRAGYHATSIACTGDVVAVAWSADDKQKRGRIVFYDADSLAEIADHQAGYLPDMIVFTRDGKRLLAANEGEPTTDYSFDPEASISIITESDGWEKATVRQAAFTPFNAARAELMAKGLHVCGPNKDDAQGLATIAEDVEPEYIAVSSDSKTAWVTLQENNAIAELDVETGEIKAIHPLGMKSFRSLGSPNQLVSFAQTTGLDVNDADGPRVRHWPIWGMYQPDGIAMFRHDGNDYLVTANEGDPRDYIDFHEVVRIGDLAATSIEIDATNPARMLSRDDQLGKLEISRYAGDMDIDGDLDRFVVPGTRSFSIWRVAGNKLVLVFDSGSEFEQIIARVAPERYNADSQADSLPDIRSPIRGPEPENIAIVEFEGRRLAAIGLERTGGAMLYDISRPHEPVFLAYLPPHAGGGLIDLAPEGLLTVPAGQSPTGKPLLILCNEGSGTMTACELSGRD